MDPFPVGLMQLSNVCLCIFGGFEMKDGIELYLLKLYVLLDTLYLGKSHRLL